MNYGDWLPSRLGAWAPRASEPSRALAPFSSLLRSLRCDSGKNKRLVLVAFAPI